MEQIDKQVDKQIDKQTELKSDGAKKPGKVREAADATAELFIQLAVLALIVFSARSSLADWYEVPSGSMLPTIQLGDRIFVNKLAYDLRVPFTSRSLLRLGEPDRGDIVVFVNPADNRTDYVKRLVGLPGDQIELRDNVLYINDQPMTRWMLEDSRLPPGAEKDSGNKLYMERLDNINHYVFEYRSPKNDNYGPEIVKLKEPRHVRLGGRPGEAQAEPNAELSTSATLGRECYFMMGDNRDNSSDSRVFGCVPRENLRGRALRVVLSFRPLPGDPPENVGRWARSLPHRLVTLPTRLRPSRVLLPLSLSD